MMRKFLGLAVCSLLVLACTNNKVTIDGEVEGGDGKILIAEKVSSSEHIFLDSLKIDEKNKFHFEADFEEPTFIRLKKNNKVFVNLLVNAGEKITFKTKYNNFTKYDLQGSEDSKLVRELATILDNTGKKIDSISNLYTGNQPVEELERIQRELRVAYYNATIKHKQQVVRFLIKNDKSLATILALYQQLDKNTYVFAEEADLQYFRLLDSTLGHKYPNHEYVKMLHDDVVDMTRKLDMKLKAEDKLKIGTNAPDIALPTIEGDTIRLSDLKGNYVVLNFWASWSEASRVNNQDLKNLYKKYEKKGLKIYQVSLDRSKKSWENAMNTDELKWVNVSDLQFWNNIAAKRYNIQSIPMSYIINPNGIIAAKSLNGEKLDNMVNWFYTNVPVSK